MLRWSNVKIRLFKGKFGNHVTLDFISSYINNISFTYIVLGFTF